MHPASLPTLAPWNRVSVSAAPGVDTHPYGFWREGDVLVVRHGATLPKRCIHTAAAQPLVPANVHVEWTPRWAVALSILLPVVGPILARATRRNAELTLFATAAVHARHER